MTALVTENLSLLTSAPNGIKKLRQLILTLAVQGRLVPQDQSEQPAAEFLSCIAAHKADAATRGRSRRTLEVPEPKELAGAPTAPPGWLWTTFGNATICRDGERIPVSQVDRDQRKKLYDYYGASGVIDKIDGYLFDKPLLLIGEDGANLVNRSSPIAFIARGQYWVNNHAHVLDGVTEGLLKYLELYINAIDLKPYVTGTAQPKMNQAKLNAIPLALPPEAEQHRIVAKVDELMALCDRLEAEQADAEAAHAQLVQALLASLTQARDAADFRASWQQLSEHFHTLFNTEASIDALKQVVLTLAVKGALVAQNADDEPASDLLNRLKFARSTSKSNDESPAAQGSDEQADMPYELPQAWAWAPLGHLVESMGSGWSPACEEGQRDDPSRWAVLRTTAVQLMQYQAHEHKAIPIHLEHRADIEVKAGDILITRAGPMNRVGISCWVDETPPRLMLSDKIVRFHPVAEEMLPAFVVLTLNAGWTKSQIELAKSGMAASQVNISQAAIRRLEVPVCSKAEQRRIVAKVDELFTLCDQLKRNLAQARQHHEKLASVLVEQAVVA